MQTDYKFSQVIEFSFCGDPNEDEEEGVLQ